jgi:enolase
MCMTAIRAIRARQILDSRGRPTVEADVTLEDGSTGRAAVPSGASTGAAEAHELRDGDAAFYGGRGVLRAVGNVCGEIAAALRGHDAMDQGGLDARLRALDGTPNLSRLGANATLAVSLATCRAAARSQKLAFYAHIARLAGVAELRMPVPMVNILSGGLHAGRGMDVQDFLAVPLRAQSMADAIHVIARVRTAADEVAREWGLPTLLADEGGLSPGLDTPRAALELMIQCISKAGLQPGQDVGIAIDVASTALRDSQGRYRFERESRTLSAAQMIERMGDWIAKYPVVSIEDGLHEEDWDNWRLLTAQLGSRVQLVGDDLFTTNSERLERGVREGIANAVLVKANQIGTLSDTLRVISQARAASYNPIVSARSGETEDPFIADLAVGTAAGQIKIGSLRTSSTVCKYNQLLRIEEESGARYAGVPRFGR